MLRHGQSLRKEALKGLAEDHEELVGRLMVRLTANGTPGSLKILDLEDRKSAEEHSSAARLRTSVNSDLGLTLSAGIGGSADTGDAGQGDTCLSLTLIKAFTTWHMGKSRQRSGRMVIYHGSGFRRALEVSIALAAVCTAVIAPLDLGFDVYSTYGWMEAMDNVCTGLFVADVLT
eukprot:5782877-Prymnesium_polylepis.1